MVDQARWRLSEHIDRPVSRDKMDMGFPHTPKAGHEERAHLYKPGFVCVRPLVRFHGQREGHQLQAKAGCGDR